MRKVVPLKMLHATSFAMLLTVSVLVPSTCAHSKTIEVKAYRLPNVFGQKIDDKADTAVMRRFLELHPNVRLKKTTGLSIEGGAKTMDMVPLMQIAGDIAPDVILVNFRMSDTYIQKGFLQPLDKYMKDWSKEEIDRRIPPSIRDVAYREGPDGKRHWYALPWVRMVRVFRYRRDFFEKAGLDPDKPPRTWEELYEYSKRLSSLPGKCGIGFHKGDLSSWDFANLVWSRGGDIIIRDSEGNWQPSFNTPEMIDALYFYVKMNKAKWKGPDGKVRRGVANRDSETDITEPAQRATMEFTYIDERLNNYKPKLIGYAPVPHAPGARSASEINAAMLGIYAGTKNPEVAKAAFDYIAFMDSDEANKTRTRIYVQRGFGKFTSPLLLEKYGYKNYLKRADKKWVEVWEDVMVNGRPEPYGRNCNMVYTELSRPVEQAINDRAVIAALDRGDEKAARRRIRSILDAAQAETAKRMYGTVPPQAQKIRHRLTWAFLIITAVGFGGVTLYLVRMFKRSAPPQMPGQKRRLSPYLLLIPALASILLWQYVPLIRGTIMAFQDYNVMGKSPYVGVENFSSVLFDKEFWHAVYITVIYTALYMCSAFVAPIVLSLLLTEVPKGKILFRTIFYLPAILSGLVVMYLWKSFYSPSGLLNTLFAYLGVHLQTSWLDAPALAMIAVVLPVIWAGMGPGSLIYLAALKTIPEEFYEAADIDGAGIFRKIWSITLPSIKMLVLINMVGALIGAFLASESIFVLTGGGPYTPYGSTEVVGLQLFYTAFMYLKFGVANAMAWVLGFMLIGFTLYQLRNLSRVEFKGGR